MLSPQSVLPLKSPFAVANSRFPVDGSIDGAPWAHTDAPQLGAPPNVHVAGRIRRRWSEQSVLNTWAIRPVTRLIATM